MRKSVLQTDIKNKKILPNSLSMNDKQSGRRATINVSRLRKNSIKVTKFSDYINKHSNIQGLRNKRFSAEEIKKGISKECINKYLEEEKQNMEDGLIDDSFERPEEKIEEEDLSSEMGLKKFMFQYKHYYQIQRNKNNDKLAQSPSINYIEGIQLEKITPRPSLIIQKSKSPGINLNKFSLGNKYANSIIRSIKNSKSVNVLSFNQNRLSYNSIKNIITSIPKTLTLLDLSNNNLNWASYESISAILNDIGRSISELILEGNNGKDDGIKYISESLYENNTLTYLNLNHNKITDIGAEHIAKMLLKNGNLKILTLHWNKIKGQGAKKIADSLSQNNSLMVFDCSFNALGTSLNNSSAIAFKNMFSKNKTLIHIDISHDSFNEEACTILSDGISLNRSLLGIHLVGNDAQVDCLGFVRPTKYNNIGTSHLIDKLNPGLISGTVSNKEMMKLQVFSNCWICEGWSQVKFIFNCKDFKINDLKEEDHIYVHLSIEDYKPSLLYADDYGNYSLERMVPPGELKFYYSINQTTIILDPKKDKIDNESNISIPKVNIYKNISQKKCELTDLVLSSSEYNPRPLPIEEKKKFEKPIWTMNQFKYKYFEPDSDVC